MKKEQQKFTFRGTYFFVAVCCLYICVLLFDTDTALTALGRSGHVLVKIIPILLLVVLLTAFLNTVVKPKQSIKYLGKESGVKGWVVAVVAGLISHGPMYAWFSLIDDLRRQGLQDRLLVTFYYARAVKLPLLPLMVDCFGVAFTCVLSFYIILGALLQGMVYQIFDPRQDSAGEG